MAKDRAYLELQATIIRRQVERHSRARRTSGRWPKVDRCTVCRKSGKSYEFDASGRCDQCAP